MNSPGLVGFRSAVFFGASFGVTEPGDVRDSSGLGVLGASRVVFRV